MRPLPGLCLLGCLFALAGCTRPDAKQDQAALRERLLDDTDERKARLKALGTLNPQEYAIMAKKMGWTTPPPAGLPPPPTVAELEQRVKEAEAKP
jgi:hypothetical protein